MNLPNLEELSFLIVFAFPYASIAGLAATIWSSSDPPPFKADVSLDVAATIAKNWITLLVLTVLPAPDSPEIFRYDYQR